jgi:hypothetical protein
MPTCMVMLDCRHRGSEVFLTSFWGMKTGEDDIKRAALLENLGERCTRASTIPSAAA